MNIKRVYQVKGMESNERKEALLCLCTPSYIHMYVCFKVRIHVRTYILVKRRKKKQTFDGDNDDEEKESNEIESIVSYIYIYYLGKGKEYITCLLNDVMINCGK